MENRNPIIINEVQCIDADEENVNTIGLPLKRRLIGIEMVDKIGDNNQYFEAKYIEFNESTSGDRVNERVFKCVFDYRANPDSIELVQNLFYGLETEIKWTDSIPVGSSGTNVSEFDFQVSVDEAMIEILNVIPSPFNYSLLEIEGVTNEQTLRVHFVSFHNTIDMTDEKDRILLIIENL